MSKHFITSFYTFITNFNNSKHNESNSRRNLKDNIFIPLDRKNPTRGILWATESLSYPATWLLWPHILNYTRAVRTEHVTMYKSCVEFMTYRAV